MAPSTSSSPSSPLLGGQAKHTTNSNDAASPPQRDAQPSRLAQGTVLALGVGRIVLGSAVVLAPVAASRAFGLPALTPETALLPRLAGVRDVVLGEMLLLSARAVAAAGPGRQDGPGVVAARKEAARRALWCSLAADAADLVASGVAFAGGNLGLGGFLWFAGGAGAFIVLAGEALMGYC